MTDILSARLPFFFFSFSAAADTVIHGKMKLHGNLDKCKTAVQAPTIGNVFEAGVGICLDVFGGMAVGAGLSEAMGGVDTTGGGDGITVDLAETDIAEADIAEADITEAGVQEADVPDTGGGNVTWGGDTAATGEVGAGEGAGGGSAFDLGGGTDGAGEAARGGEPGAGADATDGSVAPFYGDEAKFTKHTLNVTQEHFSGGAREGIANIDELVSNICDGTPDDMRVRRRYIENNVDGVVRHGGYHLQYLSGPEDSDFQRGTSG